MTEKIQTTARKATAFLMKETREAGWVHVKAALTPDGTIFVHASMTLPDDTDDFLIRELRM